MAVLSIIALMSAMLGMSLFSSGDEDLSDDAQEPELEPEIEPLPD